MVLADLTSPLGWVFYHYLFEKNRLARRWTRVRFPAAVKIFHFLITCSYLSIISSDLSQHLRVELTLYLDIIRYLLCGMTT